MPEPTQLTPEQIAALQSELATLRQTNAELVAKHTKDKARITELEAQNVEFQAKLTDAGKQIHDATVGVPLRAMAESMSKVPELFLEQFSKHFKVEMVNGALTLLSTDGKPVTGKDGKAVPFERDALTKLLTDGDDARAKTFQAITIANRASGAASPNPIPRRVSAQTKQTQFGLR